MKKIAAIIITLCLVLNLAGCVQKADNKSHKLQIITTIFPLYDFARQITGESAEINLLLPPGFESHSYEPTPKDIIKIQNCDLFIYIGGESDSWVKTILNSLDTPIKTLTLMDKVNIIEEEIVEGMQTEEESGHTEYDEHIWTSPKNAIVMAREIADKLCEVDGQNAAVYTENYNNFSTRLEEMDNDFKQFFSSAKNKTLIFGDRFPFGYFAKEYGLKYYAAFPGCSSETEPSAATIAFLIKKVKEENINTVFYIEFSNQNVANSIAKSTGAKTALMHSCHNVSKEDLEKGVTYLSLMRQNLETLKGALN